MSDERDTGHVEPLLDRFRTGELEAGERARVAAHLEGCAACRAARAELEAFSAAVARGYAAARSEAPAPDWSRQREAILARTSVRPSPRRGWLGGWMPQAAAAALAVVAIGVLWRAGVERPEDAGRALAPPRAEAPGGTRATASAPDDGPARGDVARDADAAAPPEESRFDENAAEGRGRDAEGLEAAAEAQPIAPEPQEKAALEEAEARDPPAAHNEAPAADRVGRLADRRDEADRFAAQARGALATRDTLAARRAQALWRDTLTTGAALEPDRRAALQALADSLAALLAAHP